MKKLFIQLTNKLNTNSDRKDIATLLSAFPSNNIDQQPWAGLKNNCQTSFTIVHNGVAIFLQFNVAEDIIKVNTFETNGPVNKDNCVEFFVTFGPDKKYYNLEINCTGIIRMAYGAERTNRTFITEEAIQKIKTHIKIETAPDNSLTKYLWQINLIIPIEVFEHSNLNTLNKQTGFGNFFKCGDDLPETQFYAWNKIESEQPDFHLPEFFGQLEFQ